MSCEECPCPDRCDGRPAFCRWAAAPEPDPVHLRAICASRPARAEVPAAGPAPPSAARVLATAAGAVGRLVATAASAALTGESIFVPEAESARRLAICEACPEYDPAPRRCKVCTCKMPVKVRLVSETGQCPAGKW